MKMANSIESLNGWNSASQTWDTHCTCSIWMQASRQRGKSALVQRSDCGLSPTRGSASKWLKRYLHGRKNMLRARAEGRHRSAYLPWVQQVCQQVRRFYFARKPPQCVPTHRWLSCSRFGMHSALPRDSSCIGRDLILHHHSAKVITINLTHNYIRLRLQMRIQYTALSLSHLDNYIQSCLNICLNIILLFLKGSKSISSHTKNKDYKK